MKRHKEHGLSMQSTVGTSAQAHLMRQLLIRYVPWLNWHMQVLYNKSPVHRYVRTERILASLANASCAL